MASNHKEAAVSIVDLKKTFGRFNAICGINLKIGVGEVFGLLGPNGAGKTTTMRMISCLLSPSGGEILVNRMSINDPKNTIAIRKEIGLLTETPNLYERLTAEQNLRFFARAYDIPDDQIEERMNRIFRDFDLDARRRDKAGAFSKGMKQKLAIARVLIHNPSILLLDEPTSGVDAESAKSIRDLISETARKTGNTVLLSTHNLDDASRLCDRIAILSQGKILAHGTEDSIANEIRSKVYGLGLKQDASKLIVEVINPEVLREDDLRRIVPEISNLKPLGRRSGSVSQEIEVCFHSTYERSELDLVCSRTVDAIIASGGRIASARQVRATLEDIYLQIVKIKRAGESGDSL